MRIAAIVGGLVLAGCRGESGVRAPEERGVEAVKDVGDAPVAGASEVHEKGAALGAWGVEIVVPAGASSEHEAAADRHTVYLRDGVQVGLSRVELAAPASLQEALGPWDLGDEVRKLGEGTTADGVHYAVRAFRVRDGRSSGGQHVHFFIKVARVYAVLAVGATRRIECTGYVEHDVAGADDPDLVAVREVCLSLRRA